MVSYSCEEGDNWYALNGKYFAIRSPWQGDIKCNSSDPSNFQGSSMLPKLQQFRISFTCNFNEGPVLNADENGDVRNRQFTKKFNNKRQW